MIRGDDIGWSNKGMSLNASGINYRSLKAMEELEQITDKGVIDIPR